MSHYPWVRESESESRLRRQIGSKEVTHTPVAPSTTELLPADWLPMKARQGMSRLNCSPLRPVMSYRRTIYSRVNSPECSQIFDQRNKQSCSSAILRTVHVAVTSIITWRTHKFLGQGARYERGGRRFGHGHSIDNVAGCWIQRGSPERDPETVRTNDCLVGWRELQGRQGGTPFVSSQLNLTR